MARIRAGSAEYATPARLADESRTRLQMGTVGHGDWSRSRLQQLAGDPAAWTDALLATEILAATPAGAEILPRFVQRLVDAFGSLCAPARLEIRRTVGAWTRSRWQHLTSPDLAAIGDLFLLPGDPVPPAWRAMLTEAPDTPIGHPRWRATLLAYSMAQERDFVAYWMAQADAATGEEAPTATRPGETGAWANLVLWSDTPAGAHVARVAWQRFLTAPRAVGHAAPLLLSYSLCLPLDMPVWPATAARGMAEHFLVQLAQADRPWARLVLSERVGDFLPAIRLTALPVVFSWYLRERERGLTEWRIARGLREIAAIERPPMRDALEAFVRQHGLTLEQVWELVRLVSATPEEQDAMIAVLAASSETRVQEIGAVMAFQNPQVFGTAIGPRGAEDLRGVSWVPAWSAA